MKLQHIDLSNLKRSALNARKHGGGDVSDLIPSIKRLGVLQPLLVRPNCDGYDVIAGARRLKACQILTESGEADMSSVPCAVMEEGDDAVAIEASLAENVDRLSMDELDQFKAFADLIKQGRSIEDIASRYGVTERMVRQRLAIANLIPSILSLYRKQEIESDTMRALTLATKAQQKAWLAKWRDPEGNAPQGHRLRQWLLGGQQIATNTAIFPLAEYKGAVVTDLFGEEAYFSDPDQFWTLQEKAIAEAADAYRAKGWVEIVVMEKGQYWSEYEHRRTAKKKGGKVFVSIADNGEVAFHEGFLTAKEARKQEAKKAKAQESEKGGDGSEAGANAAAQRGSGLTNAARNYVNLHRHAAVRTTLLGHPQIALRLIAAHAIGGSWLWRVQPEPQRADKADTAQSLAASKAEAVFAEERATILDTLGINTEAETVTGNADVTAEAIFETLLALDDETVERILTFVMAETLAIGTGLIDRLGGLFGVSMGEWWEADDAFLNLIRDRRTLLSMLADIGRQHTADAHRDSNAKTIRSVIRQYASGEGRAKAESWTPDAMRFVPSREAKDDQSVSEAA